MKVLAIMGSPRKGESYQATRMVEDHLKGLGDVELEYLFLRDYQLGQCIGCHLCVMKGEEYCPLKDDRAVLADKLAQADAIMLVSPVYSFHVTALMKTFIDHFTYLVHRPRFFGKPAMVLVVGGGMFQDVIKYLTKVAKSWGFNVVAELGVPHFDALTDNYRAKALREIEQASRKFHAAITKPVQPVPRMGDLIWFGIWKGNAKACRETIPRDYAYWGEQGWLERDYYYPTTIGVGKRVMMALFDLMGGMMMRRIYKGY